VNNSIRNILSRVLSAVPKNLFINFIVNLTKMRIYPLSPEESLRVLFNIENALYKKTVQEAVRYGNGESPKHRLIGFHDFFKSYIQPKQKVIDIGCGIGSVSYDIAATIGARILAIDINETSINIARTKFTYPNIEYRVGDALKDLPDQIFDAVILSNVLEHLPDRPIFLKRVYSNLHPSIILVRVPLFERDWRVPLKKELGVEWRLDSTHETEYTVESFKEEIEMAGLHISHHEVHWGEIWAVLKAL